MHDCNTSTMFLHRIGESLNPPVSKDYQLDRFFVGGRRKFLSGFTDLDLASPHIDCYSPSVASFSAPRARSAGDVGNRVMRDVSPMHFARAAAGLQVYHGKKSYRSTAEFDRPTARKIGLESATYEESLLKTKLTPPLVSTSVSSYVEKGAGSRAGKNSNNVISRRSATSTATAPSYHSLPDSYSLRAGGLNGTGVAAGSSAVKYNDDAGAEVVPSFLKNLLLSVERTEDYEKKVNQLLHNETGRNLTEFKVDRAEFDHKIGQIYDNAMNCGSGTSKGGGGSITSRRAQGYYFIAGGIRNGIRTRTQNDEQETTTAPPASSALLFRQKINQQNERKEWLFANQRIQHGNSPLNKLHETRNRVLMEDNKILPTAKTYEYKNLLVSNRAVYPSYLGSVSNSEAHRKLLLVANRFGSLRPGTRNLADCF
ncbi:unnamed protein product [Amoebophrya sp. A120]|nr:unnamed protein product [Amoebophrya sp. A120]|eukprot:GSA120T00025475001.1